MVNGKTVFVVGAGASKEVNLPVGSELKEKISTILNLDINCGQLNSGDSIVFDAFRVAARREDPNNRIINPYITAARQIHAAMPLAPSIDNFIHTHQGNDYIELCGKLAITRSILKAEQNSKLYIKEGNFHNSMDQRTLTGTWFNSFAQLVGENCTIEELKKRLSQIVFIIFNYDRCVEHFLYHAFHTYYCLDAGEAASLVRLIKIYHPYGTVGTLPWLYSSPSPVAFGADCDSQTLLNLASGIKTFTEGTDPSSSDILEIRRAMQEADTVLFLGFAFNRLNLNILQPFDNKHSRPAAVRYFGTAMGISSPDCEVLLKELVKLGGANTHNMAIRNDLTCSAFFNEYRRSLLAR